jgi:hypothetical protein
MSLVFQNIDPPSPSPPGECVLPPNTLAGRRGGWGVNILEVESSTRKTSIVQYRTLSFFAFRLKKKTKIRFFCLFKHKITFEPVRFDSILYTFQINQFASLR